MKALFISRSDLVKKSVLNGNIDADKFMQYIEIAQDIELHKLLGTKLYDKLMADIIASSISGDYSVLMGYIKPVLIHYATIEYLYYAGFEVANGGVFRHSSENSAAASVQEIEMMIDRERKTAKQYADRLVDYICANPNSFPEYYQNSTGDLSPSKKINYTNWNL